ncbi:MAG: helix-turn-helix domain-containing protein [Bacteroidales bacterium]|nr:helix-turn-helix domain-containing protein [Bacteroidales bacterium]MCM1415871.1 helix-turn-helix domain-containing protein [bacterium]
MMKDTFYIAYGSNLNVEQMRYRCPDAEAVGTGVIRDYRLTFKALGLSAFATIEPYGGEYVPVAVWRISRRDEAALDRYEGYPTHYMKKSIKVVMDGDTSEAVEGLVYIMNPRAVPKIPSRGYFEAVLSGYRSFRLEEKKLFDAWHGVGHGGIHAHNALQFYRQSMGLTQAQLSDAAGVSLKTLQKYESGERSIQRARTDTVLRLAQALDVSPYLLSRQE